MWCAYHVSRCWPRLLPLARESVARQALPSFRRACTNVPRTCRPKVAHSNAGTDHRNGSATASGLGIDFGQKLKSWRSWHSRVRYCQAISDIALCVRTTIVLLYTKMHIYLLNTKSYYSKRRFAWRCGVLAMTMTVRMRWRSSSSSSLGAKIHCVSYEYDPL